VAYRSFIVLADRRIGEPDDIALAATFLASDDARWITGQVIVAAGGKRM
jgi:3-oxoacyl-[acyl-carrier protein] reductase